MRCSMQMKTWTAATCWQLALSSSPCQQIQLRFSADEDTEDTVVGRLKYRLNKYRIRTDNIPKTKARRKRRLQPLQVQSKTTALPHQHHLGDINVVLVITIIARPSGRTGSSLSYASQQMRTQEKQW